MPKITPHEALIYVMITMSAADRQISDRELERIAEIVRRLPVFMGYDADNLAKTARSDAVTFSATRMASTTCLR